VSKSGKATIFVRFVGEGWHSWPDAPERRGYLASSHRHLFHIEARTTVEHDDREIEFHDVRDQIEVLWNLIAGPKRDLGSASCEMLAGRIGRHLCEWSGGRYWSVSVSEDNECGATVASGPDDSIT
jgi:hypothetical protein